MTHDGAKTEPRFLADVLRAEMAGEDLQDAGHCVVVCAMQQDQSLYEIGRVSAALVYQNPDAARSAIEQIKFARRTRSTEGLTQT